MSYPSEQSLIALPEDALRCVRCGYNLWARRIGECCPECGTPVLFSYPGGGWHVPRRRVPDLPVATNAKCPRCGTALGGLSARDACPGCGAPVWYCGYIGWLRAADLRWLRRVASGATCWLLSLGGHGAVLGVGAVYAMLLGGSLGSRLGGWAEGATWVLAVLLDVLFVVAAWRITAAEPIPFRRGRWLGWAPVVRAGALAVWAAGVLAAGVRYAHLGVWAQMAVRVLPLGGWLAVVGLLMCLRELARRLPDHRLARWTTGVLWAYGSAALTMHLWNVGEGVARWLLAAAGNAAFAADLYHAMAVFLRVVLLLSLLALVALLVSYWTALGIACDRSEREAAAFRAPRGDGVATSEAR